MDFVRSSGPGGQNVNKVSTAAQLRFDIPNSPSLSDAVKRRLINLAGKRVSGSGVLIIHANRHRQQRQNRNEAVERLTAMIRQAAKSPKKRRKTKPTPASRRKRLESKKQRSQLKKLRKAVASSQ